MGNEPSCNKINFEDLQDVLFDNNVIIISTLPSDRQFCLVQGTRSITDEINVLNSSLEKNSNIPIVVYGENSCDKTVFEKYKQLINYGFSNVYIYTGGLFEWLLLQDIYGKESFPTTSSELDLLKYKGRKVMNVKLIEN